MSEKIPGHDAQLREQGRHVMAEIMGEKIMHERDRLTNSFNAPLRRLSESFAYGDIWSRPGLPRATRSLLTLVMLTALGRHKELHNHLEGALNNGCTVQEIQEALLHTAVYCGIPATLEAFQVAEQVLGERIALVDAQPDDSFVSSTSSQGVKP